MAERTIATSIGESAPFDRRRGRSVVSRLRERDGHLDELAALHRGLVPSPPAAVVVEGVWGSGKTALLNAACHAALVEGARVGRARARPQHAEEPYRLAVEMVEAVWAASEPGSPIRPVSSVARLGEVDDDEQMVDHLVAALEPVGQRVVLAVDDADKADSQSLRALNAAVRRVPPGRAVLWTTAGPRIPGTPLRSVDWLLAEPDTRLLPIAPLSKETVGEIAQDVMSEQLGREWVDAIWRVTGGRPLFLFALLGSLVEPLNSVPPGDASLAEVGAGRLVPAVLSRLAGMRSTVAELMTAAAVLGEGTDVGLIAHLADLDQGGAEGDADVAVHAELLSSARPIKFTSPLVRMAIHSEIPADRRGHLHRAAADLLERQGSSEEVICGHLRLSHPAGESSVASRLRDCARLLFDEGRPADAAGLLERALAEPPKPEEVPDVLIDLAIAEMEVGSPAATEHFLRAARLGGADPQRLTAAATMMLRRVPASKVLEPPAFRAISEALDAVGVSAERVSLDLHLALCRSSRSVSPGDIETLRTRAQRLRAEDAVGVRRVDAYLTQEMFRTVGGRDAGSTAERLLETFDVHELSGRDVLAAEVQQASALVLLCCGRLEVIDLVERHARAVDPRSRDAAPLNALIAMGKYWQGQLEASIAVSRRALSTGGAGKDWAARLLHACLAAALLDKGRIGEAMAVESALAIGSDIADDWPFDIVSTFTRLFARTVGAALWTAVGSVGRSMEQLQAAHDFATAAAVNNPALTTWPVDLADLKASVGARDEAHELASEFLSTARTVGDARTISRALRTAATVAGLEQGEALLREAADLVSGSAFRLDEAKILIQLGRCLMATGRRDEARNVLREGANLAALCGADGLVQQAGADLRAAGARPRRIAVSGWEALTPAERRVAELARGGATNAQIAAALYVTEKTVEGHLARVYRKLGVRSRAQLQSPLGRHADGVDGQGLP